jgi:chaperone modulatory protein CbpM
MKEVDLQTTLNGVILDEQTELTLIEMSSACAVEVGSIVELVEEGVLEPSSGRRSDWRFRGSQLRRALTAMRLQRDLSINTAGVALALQLLDEIDALRVRLTTLERE